MEWAAASLTTCRTTTAAARARTGVSSSPKPCHQEVLAQQSHISSAAILPGQCLPPHTPPSTAGSSFLLPSSNRKLPPHSQGCKCLTLRGSCLHPTQAQPSSIARPYMSQYSLVAPPSCPQSHLLAHLQSLSTSTFNRSPGFLFKHSLFIALVLINHQCNASPLLAFLLQVNNADTPNPPSLTHRSPTDHQPSPAFRGVQPGAPQELLQM